MNKAQLKALKLKALKAKQAHLQLCRDDFPTFAGYVLKDQVTGDPISPGWIHRKWGNMLKSLDRVAFLAQTKLGKTQQLSVAYILWRIGRNVRIRACVISNSETGSAKIVRQIQDYITSSKEYAEVFPHVKKGKIWKSTMFEIERPSEVTDATVAGYGVDSKSITGSRLDLIILDDVDNNTTTSTQHQRQKQYNFITQVAMSRLEEDGQAISVANAWHKDDLTHRLKKDGWPTYICPAVITEEVLKQWPDCPYKVGEPLWPEMWSPEALAKKKRTTPAIEWNRAMMCIPASDATSLFDKDSIERAKLRGDYLKEVFSIRDLLLEAGFSDEEIREELDSLQGNTEYEEPAFHIIHGVDLSTGRGNDQAAIVTIAMYPDATRRLLRVETGHWQGKEIADRLADTYRRYGGIFSVESVGMQRQVMDLIGSHTPIPMFPYNTHRFGKIIGFSAISAEFAADRWIIPAKDGKASQDIEAMLEGLRDFNPNSHTIDSAMALLFAVTLLRHLETMLYEQDQESEDGITISVIG